MIEDNEIDGGSVVEHVGELADCPSEASSIFFFVMLALFLVKWKSIELIVTD